MSTVCPWNKDARSEYRGGLPPANISLRPEIRTMTPYGVIDVVVEVPYRHNDQERGKGAV